MEVMKGEKSHLEGRIFPSLSLVDYLANHFLYAAGIMYLSVLILTVKTKLKTV